MQEVNRLEFSSSIFCWLLAATGQSWTSRSFYASKAVCWSCYSLKSRSEQEGVPLPWGLHQGLVELTLHLFFFFRFLGASNHMTLLKCCEVLQPFSPSAVCMVCPQGFAVTVK